MRCRRYDGLVPQGGSVLHPIPRPFRRSVSLVAAALVFGLLASGCTSGIRRVVSAGSAPAVRPSNLSSPSASPSGAASAAGSGGGCVSIPIGVSFDFDGPVPLSDRTEIRRASLKARVYYHVSTSSCAQERVVVFAHERSNRKAIALTHGWNSIEVFTKSPSWLAASTTDRMVVMLHEWYHVLQARVASSGFSEVPAWIIEGSAEWSARRAATDLGLFATFDGPRATELGLARFATVSLAHWKRFVPNAYPLAFAAVDFLVTPRDGRQRLLRFFRLVGERFEWAAAFRRAFGITARQFMVAFAAYRSRGFVR